MYGWKIVRNNCFLCSFPLIPQVRISVFGKSSVDIAHLIECAVEIYLGVFSSSDLFVCNRCFKRLLCFEKAKTNLWSLQEEIHVKEGFKQQRSAAKQLKFEQFPTTSISSNAEHDRTVGESCDILSGCTWLSAQETPSTREGSFRSPVLPSLYLKSTPVTSTGNFNSQPGTEPCNPAVKILIQYSSKLFNKYLPSDYNPSAKLSSMGHLKGLLRPLWSANCRPSTCVRLCFVCFQVKFVVRVLGQTCPFWGNALRTTWSSSIPNLSAKRGRTELHLLLPDDYFSIFEWHY